jgi:signal transduction histidine kinase
MNRLLNKSLKKLLVVAALVLTISIPIYYWAINRLWQYEMDEHNIILTPEAEQEDRVLIISAITGLTILFFALLLAVFIWVNRNISRRMWRPFYKSLADIKHFDLAKNKSIVLGKTEITEFAELNESLNKLIAANVTVYNQQKEFAENASHELQTPLAIVQSKLELLLQSQSLRNEQYTIIEDAIAAINRVSRINKNLLLLTKIENSQYMDKEEINLSEMLVKDITQFALFSQDKEMNFKTDIHPGVKIEGNKILVEILVHNLITNAIRHSPRGSSLMVQLDGNGMDFSNSGQSPLNPDQLFKRFVSASLQTPGTGLGLALVKQICNRYNWQIAYAFSDDRHVFSLRF